MRPVAELGASKVRTSLPVRVEPGHHGMNSHEDGCPVLQPVQQRFRHIRSALDKMGERVIRYPDVPYTKLPEFHMISDLVVLSQMYTPFGKAQLPMKLLDAMAMANPVISTKVSDIPHILEGCGRILTKNDVDELVENVQVLHDDPARMRALGESARKKCVERDSYAQGKQILIKAIKES